MARPQRWNKLVRDNIPDQLRLRGIKVVFRDLKDFFERDLCLRKKATEEAQEVLKAKTQEGLLEEIADATAVHRALLRLHGLTISDLENAVIRKEEEKGGFEKFCFLVTTEEPDRVDGRR